MALRCGSEVPLQITKKSVKLEMPRKIDRDDVFRLFVRGEFRAAEG